MFVGSDALSTASIPFTPTANPADELTESHPAPGQLTGGGVGSAPFRGRVGDGNTCGASVFSAELALALALALVVPLALAFGDVEMAGVANGPESREHPADEQPVAAEPTNVGVPVPGNEDTVRSLADDPVLDEAADDPATPVVARNASGRENKASSANFLRNRPFRKFSPFLSVAWSPR